MMPSVLVLTFLLLLVAPEAGFQSVLARHTVLRTERPQQESNMPILEINLPVQTVGCGGPNDGEGSLPISCGIQTQTKPSVELNGDLSRVSEWLASEHDHMIAILNQLRVGVVIVNREGCVIFVSKAADNLFDRDHIGVLGQSWQDVLPLENGTKTRLLEMLNLASVERKTLAVEWCSGAHRRFWMEIEVLDDPHEPSNKIFYFYDVSEVADLHTQLKDMTQFQGLNGQSRVMQAVYREIKVVARANTTVLIDGETGTGKELVARAIHYTSARKERLFLAINCAGLSEGLLGSQLFGHKRGAFTGAIADQVGLFEAAHGGTLFLDEVGDIPLSVQSSLLRVLQEKEITRLGETRPRKVDVRIVAATHRDLSREVSLGNFRDDLFYRICVAKISLPPLRERLEDLPVLARGFLEQACASLNVSEPQVAAETMATLCAYGWPGNVRELKSVIESALINSDGRVIQPFNLPPEIAGPMHGPSQSNPQDERERILSALRRTNGNRTEAARLLGVSRATFYRTLSRLQILQDA